MVCSFLRRFESGTDAAFESIDVDGLYRLLVRLKKPGLHGGFSVTDDGEADVRALYFAMTIASLCNLFTDELTRGVDVFIKSLQGFDGGFGGEAGNESHGGYTYCGLASLSILCNYDMDRMAEIIDIDSLQRWAVMRQMSLEGGFSVSVAPTHPRLVPMTPRAFNEGDRHSRR